MVSPGSVLGANEEIRVAVVGLGVRGNGTHPRLGIDRENECFKDNDKETPCYTVLPWPLWYVLRGRR